MIHDMSHLRLPRTCLPLAVFALLLVSLMMGAPGSAKAADRAKIEAFLTVTGFDVALDSISLSASNAPSMLGMQEEEFGHDWQWLARQVFDTRVMRGLAEDILEATLSDKALSHAAGFYAGHLGQRLVEAENASHLMEDRDARQAEGTKIVADLVGTGAPRLELIKRMNRAVSSTDTSVAAMQEIQLRFLLAANAAGVIKLKVDMDELRAIMKSQEGEMRLDIQKSALAGSAYTYRDFSDADIETYTKALEHPEMQEVYELLNAVQYEIMANRFEVLAARMAKMHPSEDI